MIVLKPQSHQSGELRSKPLVSNAKCSTVEHKAPQEDACPLCHSPTLLQLTTSPWV